MKITRTAQYKEMLKLLSSAKSIQAHLERISSMLNSQALLIPNTTGHFEIVRELVPPLMELAVGLGVRCLQLKKDFEDSKPSRFTESQLSEMRNLRKIGMPINKLSKYFASSDVTIKKHLSESD